MSAEPKKKKIMIKRKGDSSTKAKKPVIKLNKEPKEDEEQIPPTEELPKDTEKLAKPEAEKPTKPEAEEKAKPESAPTEKTPAAKEEPEKKEEKEEKPVKQAEEPVFKFYCVYCGQKLSASPSMTGQKIPCPSCGHKIQVPEAP